MNKNIRIYSGSVFGLREALFFFFGMFLFGCSSPDTLINNDGEQVMADGVVEANLTRFGPETYELVRGTPVTHSHVFKAFDGGGKLVIQDYDIDKAWIKVNGATILEPNDFSGEGEIILPLQLKKENTIEVTVPGLSKGKLGVRVTQITQANLGLQQQNYFGLQTSDMEAQREFYNTLGFTGEIYPAGPETSTVFARGLGFTDNYLIHVALTSLEDPPKPPFIDTVQFRGDSYREEPPYANLNHIGMAYATYSTTDLAGDYLHLKEKGIDFVSSPATAPNGEQFVFLRDQDGTYLKLIQAAERHESTPGPNLLRLVNTNMNVADLERSREFYRLLGFTESKPVSQAGSGQFAKAHGFNESIEFEGEDISLGSDTDGATIQLRQWRDPYDDSPSYPPPVNHLGIDRIAFSVKDLTSVIKTMTDLGFEQLAPVASPGGALGSYGLVFFYDPDGIKIQFSGPLTD